MKLRPLIILLFAITFFTAALSSCKEFIEPSIAKKEVQPEAPGDKFQSTKYTINFWWDTVDDALSYRLQVVTPGFYNIGGLVVDTLIRGNKFSINIDPGNYEWRVRAENGNSQTAYSTPRQFNVVSSSLTNQTVTLSSPANNYLTNLNTVLFKWGSLYGTTKYRLEIDSNNFADENTIVSQQVIPGQQFSFKFPKDQQYQWRVRAENAAEQSQWSTVNFITYDSTPPAAVKPGSPLKNALTFLPVSLNWNSVASAANYKLYIYKSDSTSLYNNSFPLILNTGSYSFNTGNTGDRIYWKVTALDAAGNESQTGELRSFLLQ